MSGTMLKPGPFDAAPTEDSAHRVSDPAPVILQDFPPLSLLAHETRAVPALLLSSIANSHRSAFDHLGSTIHMVGDLEVVAGDFEQRQTGHRYLVTVTPVLGDAVLCQSGTPLSQEIQAVLTDAESFVAGFEGDELQEGIAELLARMRRLLPGGALQLSTEGMPT